MVTARKPAWADGRRTPVNAIDRAVGGHSAPPRHGHLVQQFHQHRPLGIAQAVKRLALALEQCQAVLEVRREDPRAPTFRDLARSSDPFGDRAR